MIAPQCVSFDDHCYASVANTCRGPKFFFWACSAFDIVTPAQVSETSSRSQRGGSVMASNSSSAAARKSQVAVARKSQVAVAIALQSVKNKEASNANCE